ncbi:hypothetical protein K474DRAFT_689860 [Panus rudis PR-1116 ss-1]|nr:hypothetical protein K474DRAFT_689860 [Panus rudis PR-1116 ss-1]
MEKWGGWVFDVMLMTKYFGLGMGEGESASDRSRSHTADFLLPLFRKRGSHGSGNAIHRYFSYCFLLGNACSLFVCFFSFLEDIYACS